MLRTLSVLAVCAMSACVASPVLAQQQEAPCVPLDVAMNELIQDFGEAPVGLGISEQGHFMQLFVNDETGSWTIILTNPVNGETCIADMGMEFMRARVKPNV